MAYDERLADRVRVVLGEQVPFTEIKMFGGLCFTVNGNMALGVLNDDLMVRVSAQDHDRVLKQKGARPMDFTKRPMAGFVFVEPSATKTDAGLKRWARLALEYNATLPPKAPKAPRAPRDKRA